MSDARLRELERRWRESGEEEDRLAYVAAQERAGDVEVLAVLGGVHGNLQALQAVLADLEERGVRRLVCLGGVVGYGPNPVEVLELLRERCEFVLRGRWEDSLVRGNRYFGHNARRCLEWTRRRLVEASSESWDRVRYLGQLPLRRDEGRDLYLYGTPGAPIHGRFILEDIRHRELGGLGFQESFEDFERFLFTAAANRPLVATRDQECFPPVDIQRTYRCEDRPAIVHVGSVGQPRDRDTRACYVILRGDEVEWRRVEYPVEETARLIEATPGIPRVFAQRLRAGV